MARYYMMNMAGCQLTDEEMEKIPYPRLEVFSHITMKTSQAGALFGSVLLGPCVSIAKGNSDFKSIQESSYHYGKNGLVIGSLLGPVAFLARMATMKTGSAYDSAYRLRVNSNQVLVDRMSLFGLFAGLGAAKCCGEELARGAFFGFTGGCLMAGFFNYMF